jgi:chemotaxis protein MotB
MKPLLSFQNADEHSETAGNNRWMISYADFITLLFVLFLVLYARLPKQIVKPVEVVQKTAPAIIPGLRPRHMHVAIAKPPPVEPITSPTEKQEVLMQELTSTLTDLVQVGDVTLVQRQEGVLLEIKDTALFASGTAQPADKAGAIVAKIAEVLEKNANQVVVEGHTDSVPIQTAQYPSNWELSSARAASVVRALQERGISPGRMAASGLAETKPKSTNETAQGRSENRRVSLLVLNE